MSVSLVRTRTYRTYRKELQEHAILAITELKFEDSIGAHLSDCRQPSGLKKLPETRNEYRGSRGGRACELRQVTTKSGINNKLLLIVGFRKLEKKNFGRKVVYIRESKSHQAFLELMCNDLVQQLEGTVNGSHIALTFTSNEENLCFILNYSLRAKIHKLEKLRLYTTSSRHKAIPSWGMEGHADIIWVPRDFELHELKCRVAGNVQGKSYSEIRYPTLGVSDGHQTD